MARIPSHVCQAREEHRDPRHQRMTFCALQGQDWLVQHCAACDGVAAAKTAAAMGPALLVVEDILFSNGCMVDSWEQFWQAMWRKNVLSSPDLKESLLYVATLQARNYCTWL